MQWHAWTLAATDVGPPEGSRQKKWFLTLSVCGSVAMLTYSSAFWAEDGSGTLNIALWDGGARLGVCSRPWCAMPQTQKPNLPKLQLLNCFLSVLLLTSTFSVFRCIQTDCQRECLGGELIFHIVWMWFNIGLSQEHFWMFPIEGGRNQWRLSSLPQLKRQERCWKPMHAVAGSRIAKIFWNKQDIVLQSMHFSWNIQDFSGTTKMFSQI